MVIFLSNGVIFNKLYENWESGTVSAKYSTTHAITFPCSYTNKNYSIVINAIPDWFTASTMNSNYTPEKTIIGCTLHFFNTSSSSYKVRYYDAIVMGY